MGKNVGGCALGDDMATVNAGAGADIDDVVRRQDGILVVFNDNDGVAEVTQAPQRIEQAGIVALMQADRGLVEDIEHAGQAGTDLAGEADALAFAARQRTRIATESVRYSRPTSLRKLSRSRISLRTRSPICICVGLSFSGKAPRTRWKPA